MEAVAPPTILPWGEVLGRRKHRPPVADDGASAQRNRSGSQDLAGLTLWRPLSKLSLLGEMPVMVALPPCFLEHMGHMGPSGPSLVLSTNIH